MNIAAYFRFCITRIQLDLFKGTHVMRFNSFLAVIAAVGFVTNGAASACSFYQPGRCGSSEASSKISLSAAQKPPSTVAPYGLSTWGFIALASPLDRDAHFAPAEFRSETARTVRDAGGLGSSAVGSQQSFSSGAGYSSGQSTSRWSPRGGEEDLKFALNGANWIELANPDSFLQKFGDGNPANDPRATPLPASWTLMLAGFALFGILAFYRKFKTPQAPMNLGGVGVQSS